MPQSEGITRRLLEAGEPLELSFVELVIAAADTSEDQGEIRDAVDALIGSGCVRLHTRF